MRSIRQPYLRLCFICKINSLQLPKIQPFLVLILRNGLSQYETHKAYNPNQLKNKDKNLSDFLEEVLIYDFNACDTRKRLTKFLVEGYNDKYRYNNSKK